jgi:hypothetical protein
MTADTEFNIQPDPEALISQSRLSDQNNEGLLAVFVRDIAGANKTGLQFYGLPHPLMTSKSAATATATAAAEGSAAHSPNATIHWVRKNASHSNAKSFVFMQTTDRGVGFQRFENLQVNTHIAVPASAYLKLLQFFGVKADLYSEWKRLEKKIAVTVDAMKSQNTEVRIGKSLAFIGNGTCKFTKKLEQFDKHDLCLFVCANSKTAPGGSKETSIFLTYAVRKDEMTAAGEEAAKTASSMLLPSLPKESIRIFPETMHYLAEEGVSFFTEQLGHGNGNGNGNNNNNGNSNSNVNGNSNNNNNGNGNSNGNGNTEKERFSSSTTATAKAGAPSTQRGYFTVSKNVTPSLSHTPTDPTMTMEPAKEPAPLHINIPFNQAQLNNLLQNVSTESELGPAPTPQPPPSKAVDDLFKSIFGSDDDDEDTNDNQKRLLTTAPAVSHDVNNSDYCSQSSHPPILHYYKVPNSCATTAATSKVNYFLPGLKKNSGAVELERGRLTSAVTTNNNNNNNNSRKRILSTSSASSKKVAIAKAKVVVVVQQATGNINCLCIIYFSIFIVPPSRWSLTNCK